MEAFKGDSLYEKTMLFLLKAKILFFIQFTWIKLALPHTYPRLKQKEEGGAWAYGVGGKKQSTNLIQPLMLAPPNAKRWKDNSFAEAGDEYVSKLRNRKEK